MENDSISILVTGVGGGSLGREIIKSLKMINTNYNIIATDLSENSIGLFEADKGYIIPKSSSPHYMDVILKICKIENIKIVIAGSEPEIEMIAKNEKIFIEQGITILSNSFEIIKQCSDKFSIINFLKSKGITCPTSTLYENEKDLDLFSSYPIIIKPRFGSGSRNVFIAYDKEDALLFANYIKKYGQEVVLQEHIGNHEQEYTIGVLYADNGKLCTSIGMRRILEGGISTRQISYDPQSKQKNIISSGVSQGYFDDFPELRKFGEQIASIIGGNGPINIQCRQTEKGLIPFEINPRFSGTVALRSLVGHNEPNMLLRYKLFDEIPQQSKTEFGLVLKDFTDRLINSNELGNFQKYD